jgi:hypothetical protein
MAVTDERRRRRTISRKKRAVEKGGVEDEEPTGISRNRHGEARETKSRGHGVMLQCDEVI